MRLSRIYLLWLYPAALLVIGAWPVPGNVLHPSPLPAVQVEDRNGKLLYEARGADVGSYTFVALDDMPQSLIDAVISIEDRDFYVHPGVNIFSIARAVWQNVTAGKVISGASSITQQLARNRLHPERRTIPYKLKEAYYALRIEQVNNKNQILESYLNTVYFGHQAYGIAAASKIFFGKSPAELSLAESSLLAGLVQSPSALDPFSGMKRARERQKRVLDAMVVNGKLEREAADEAAAQSIALTKDRIAIAAPHFVMWLQGQRPEAFENGGHVRTTLDLNLQSQAEDIVRRKLETLKDKNVTSAAVVVLDAHNGDVLTMVGSADYFDVENDGAVNVATSARQPGSTMKAFTYALALAEGDTPATTVADVETQFFTKEGNPYTPRNYDYGEHGLVRYREALANSYNIAAVKVLERVGVGTLLDFMKNVGFTTLTQAPDHYGLALTLGDAEVTLLDLASAYGLFPRGGVTLKPRVLLNDAIEPGDQVLDPKIAWQITDILSDNEARVSEFGENSPLRFDAPVAAKTGTTRNSRDNWTVGYTPDYVVGVWVGNADNAPMHGTTGVTGAGPIFHDVMEILLTLAPDRGFTRPSGLTQVEICRVSGKLPTPECGATTKEWFVSGTVPTQKDDVFRSVNVDVRNGLLATDACDAKFTVRKPFAIFPPEVRTWARMNGYALPPAEKSPLCNSLGALDSFVSLESSWVQILSPQTNDSFKLDPLIPDADERVVFKAQASGDIEIVDWYVDGAKAGHGNAPDFRFDWRPIPGRHEIEIRSGNLSQNRSIEIVR